MNTPKRLQKWYKALRPDVFQKKLGIKKVGHFAFRSCPTYCICKPLFLLHICSKSSTFAGLFAKGHFSSLPIVLSFSSLPLPPVLFLPVLASISFIVPTSAICGVPEKSWFLGCFSHRASPFVFRPRRFPAEFRTTNKGSWWTTIETILRGNQCSCRAQEDN